MTQATIIDSDSNPKSKAITLLMIHGAAGGAWYFHNYLDYFFKHGIKAHAIDLRGHKNGLDEMDFTLADYVDDVINAARTYEPEHLIILGHSMGAAVVLKALEKAHDLCQGAILMSPPPIMGIDSKSPLGLFFGDMLGYLREARKDNVHQGLSLEGLLSKMMFNDHLGDDAIKTIRKRLIKESQAVKLELLKPYLKDHTKIKTKMVLIGSKDDQLVHIQDLIEMRQMLSCQLEMLDDLPHFMMLDPKWELSAQTVLQCIYALHKDGF